MYAVCLGPVEMEFEGFEKLEVVDIMANAGQTLLKKLRVYGHPIPELSIAKIDSDGVIRGLSDSRVTVTLNQFIFQSIQLRDAGVYAIWGNNTHGDVMYSFNITVTGMC